MYTLYESEFLKEKKDIEDFFFLHKGTLYYNICDDKMCLPPFFPYSLSFATIVRNILFPFYYTPVSIRRTYVYDFTRATHRRQLRHILIVIRCEICLFFYLFIRIFVCYCFFLPLVVIVPKSDLIFHNYYYSYLIVCHEFQSPLKK